MQQVFGFHDPLFVAKGSRAEHVENVLLDRVEDLDGHLVFQPAVGFRAALCLLQKNLFGVYHFLTVSIGFTPNPKM